MAILHNWATGDDEPYSYEVDEPVYRPRPLTRAERLAALIERRDQFIHLGADRLAADVCREIEALKREAE